MKNHLYFSSIFVLLLLLNGCSLQESVYQKSGIPPKPPLGYSRQELFPHRIATAFVNPMFNMLNTRVNWNRQENLFKSLYPKFTVNLIVFNNIIPHNVFSWQERLMLSDALELIIFAVNHPDFVEEMNKQTFYNKDGNGIVASETIANNIKSSTVNLSISKDTLDAGVLAQATLGSTVNTIWFRNDTDYQDYNLISLIIVFSHELMHNLGYSHESRVPCRIQYPIIDILEKATPQEVLKFQYNTPHYEVDFLNNIRSINTRTKSNGRRKTIIKDYYSNFKI